MRHHKTWTPQNSESMYTPYVQWVDVTQLSANATEKTMLETLSWIAITHFIRVHGWPAHTKWRNCGLLFAVDDNASTIVTIIDSDYTALKLCGKCSSSSKAVKAQKGTKRSNFADDYGSVDFGTSFSVGCTQCDVYSWHPALRHALGVGQTTQCAA